MCACTWLLVCMEVTDPSQTRRRALLIRVCAACAFRPFCLVNAWTGGFGERSGRSAFMSPAEIDVSKSWSQLLSSADASGPPRQSLDGDDTAAAEAERPTALLLPEPRQQRKAAHNLVITCRSGRFARRFWEAYATPAHPLDRSPQQQRPTTWHQSSNKTLSASDQTTRCSAPVPFLLSMQLVGARSACPSTTFSVA